jgi:Flp pilus assembly protein TadG
LGERRRELLPIEHLRAHEDHLSLPRPRRAGAIKKPGPESGSILVEFAVSLSVLTLVFIGVADYALMIQQALLVTGAAAAGAAYGVIPGNQTNLSGMQTAARNTASGVSGFSVTATDVFTCTPGGASVSSSSTCSGYGTPIEYVQVTTSATVNPLLSWTGISASTLTGTASFRVAWTQ